MRNRTPVGRAGSLCTKDFPTSAFNPKDTAPPIATPTAVNTKPRRSTRPQQVGKRRPESHAQAEFAGALRDGVGHQRRKARWRKAVAPAPPKLQPGSQPPIAAKSSDPSCSCSEMTSKKREIPVERMNLACQAPSSSSAALNGVLINSPPTRKILAQRAHRKWFWRFSNAFVLGVFRHADHLHPSALHLNALADGIPASPISAQPSFHFTMATSAAFSSSARLNSPAGYQRDAHCREIIPGPLSLYSNHGPVLRVGG